MGGLGSLVSWVDSRYKGQTTTTTRRGFSGLFESTLTLDPWGPDSRAGVPDFYQGLLQAPWFLGFLQQRICYRLLSWVIHCPTLPTFGYLQKFIGLTPGFLSTNRDHVLSPPWPTLANLGQPQSTTVNHSIHRMPSKASTVTMVLLVFMATEGP